MSQIALPLDACPEAPSQTLKSATGVPCACADMSVTSDQVTAQEGPVTDPGSCAGFEAEGFRIGWEHARYLTTPPADHLHAGHPVRHGWEAGRAAFAGRTLAPARAARLWLALRLQAWLRGHAFDELMVTPRFVARIDVGCCPITQVALTHSPAGAESATDAVVMPLHERAGCVAGNLAVVSRQVAQARAALSHQEMVEIVRGLELSAAASATSMVDGQAAGRPPFTGAAVRSASTQSALDTVAGLDLAAWRRLQALTSLATPQAHDQAAAQPLHVLPPPRVRLLNPVQGLQAVLTLVFTGPGYARQLTDLGAFMPHAQARRAYFLFMNAMLARRLSVRGAVPPAQVRQALEQAWRHPLVQQRWQALAQVITPAQAERVLRLVAQRGAVSLGGAGAARPADAVGAVGGAVGTKGFAWRWMDASAATEGWALETQVGSTSAATMHPVSPHPVSAEAGAPARGPARSRRLHRSAGEPAPHGGAGQPTGSRVPGRRPVHGSV